MLAHRRARLLRRFRVRTLLFLLVLVPTTGMVGLATLSASDRWDDHRVTTTVHDEAVRMIALVEARTALMSERIGASVMLKAAEFGFDPANLFEIFGVDYAGELAAGREHVDASEAITADPVLAEARRALQQMRPAVDDGSADYDEFVVVFDALADDIDARWLDARRTLEAAVDGADVPAAMEARMRALRASFDVFESGRMRIRLTDELALGTAARLTVRDLIEADIAMDSALAIVHEAMGTRATEAWKAIDLHPSTARFDLAVERLIVDLLAKRVPDLRTNQISYGFALSDGATWLSGLSTFTGAVSADLGAVAAGQAADDIADFWRELAVVGAAVLVALASVAALAGAIARPLRRIGAAVQAVHDGSFDLPTMAATGPRELAETAIAVNEMATTLGAVEARAVALAEEADHTNVLPPLPGRTGQALQTALDRLQNLATHDGLTGLLNRSAALDAIGRDFARTRRDGGRVMALFVDLDGLKEINDTFGHNAGDGAIALVAEVLRDASRDADVVARIGGDEFLVAGIVRETDVEVEALAARLRTAVEHAVLHVDGTDVHVRCSVGAAVADPHTSSVEALIDEADTAMYEEKLAHRRSAAAA